MCALCRGLAEGSDVTLQHPQLKEQMEEDVTSSMTTQAHVEIKNESSPNASDAVAK